MDSRAAIEQVWREWAATKGFDFREFLRVAHGRRTSETIRLVAPELDARAEAAVLDAMEAVETRGLVPFPGAEALVRSLPRSRWAVVTSGTTAVATLRLRTAGIPIPPAFLTADDVRRGKPDPEGYLTAADLLGVASRDCVVVEDSPTGVAAGRAAGMKVVAVLTTYPPAAVAEADVIVPALTALRVRHEDGTGLEVDWSRR